MFLQNFQNFGHFENTGEKNDVWETFSNSILLLSYLVIIIFLGKWTTITPWSTCSSKEKGKVKQCHRDRKWNGWYSGTADDDGCPARFGNPTATSAIVTTATADSPRTEPLTTSTINATPVNGLTASG